MIVRQVGLPTGHDLQDQHGVTLILWHPLRQYELTFCEVVMEYLVRDARINAPKDIDRACTVYTIWRSIRDST